MTHLSVFMKSCAVDFARSSISLICQTVSVLALYYAAEEKSDVARTGRGKTGAVNCAPISLLTLMIMAQAAPITKTTRRQERCVTP